MKILFTMVGLCLLFGNATFAQTDSYKLSDLPLKDNSVFKNPPTNWQIKGSVSGAYDAALLKTQNGVSVLFNNFDTKKQFSPEQNLFTNFQHEDIYLEFDFMMPKGSNSGVYFQSRYEIQLFDSWGRSKPKGVDCGAIYERWNDKNPEGKKGYEGHPPRVNTSFAPGLWQHIAITFEAPKFDGTGKKIKNAKFVKVVMNGITIHENVPLTGPTRASAAENEVASAPIMIQGDHGQVAFKNIKYALLGDFSLALKDLQYEFFDLSKGYEKRSSKPDKVGAAEAIDYRYADNPDKLLMNFKGKFEVKEADDYTFSLKRNGSGSLKIDGNEVIKSDWRLIPDVSNGTINLAPGEHTIEVTYSKDFTWRQTALGVAVQRTNTKPVALNDAASLPDIPSDPEMIVTAKSNTEIQRSYWALDGKKKLTHALAVGMPSGLNFVYNLNQASVHGFWKGDFLRTTDMWYERGEPQEAQALGSLVKIMAKCPLAGKVLTDTLEDRKELVYKGYSLDENKTPTFEYALNGQLFTDKMTPNVSNNGLVREIKIKGTPNGEQFRLADGESIEEVSKNVYIVNNQFYVTVPKDIKPAIIQQGGKKILVVSTAAKKPISSISYELLW